MESESLSNLQDVLRCGICETPVPLSFCVPCHINLCKDCVAEHLLDGCIEHSVVPMKKRWSTNYPECSKHSTKQCEMFCKQCDVAICAHCIISKDHKTHEILDIWKSFDIKKKALESDLKELEESIYPKYQQFASKITVQKDDLIEKANELKMALDKQRDVWHVKIDAIIKCMQCTIDTKVSKYQAELDKREIDVNNNILEISKIILNLKKLEHSSGLLLLSTFKSRNAEFKKLPPLVKVSLPSFSPGSIDTEQLSSSFGSLDEIPEKTEK